MPWKLGLLAAVTLLAAGDAAPAAPSADWIGTGAHLSATAVLASVAWKLFELLGRMLDRLQEVSASLDSLGRNCAARAAEQHDHAEAR